MDLSKKKGWTNKRFVTFKTYEHADEETGEILRTGTKPKGYNIKSNETTYRQTETHTIKDIRYWCERDEQLKLF